MTKVSAASKLYGVRLIRGVLASQKIYVVHAARFPACHT